MKALVGNSLSHQSCRLIVALIIIICIDSAASFIIYVYLIYFTSAAPVHPSNHEDKNKNDQREGERDRETDKYCLKMLLCLLLECCLEYLSASISIPRRSINIHTAQPHAKLSIWQSWNKNDSCMASPPSRTIYLNTFFLNFEKTNEEKWEGPH